MTPAKRKKFMSLNKDLQDLFGILESQKKDLNKLRLDFNSAILKLQKDDPDDPDDYDAYHRDKLLNLAEKIGALGAEIGVTGNTTQSWAWDGEDILDDLK